ncbi:ubiquitin-associated and SH3 domain-containing protein A [Xenopus tropicalis]|uniref:Ubiquitin-associated and SH3 domain-containing protein A n=1 Tax=Xenopus tropicalis TaxID=8364 RepID=A0A8J1J6G2_XENTR|nr:ubiquitin-associated and SH3 domain-containing protein A [Xenopus tropicalis]
MSVSGNNMAHRAVSPHYAKISHRVSGSSSLLDPLLSMGFPEHQVQKALAATGRTSVELAAKWLKSHDKDPSLDDPIPQEYVLYLVPTGPLAVTLSNFWAESLRLCGRNRAHSCFPHITLCEFFTCEDRKVETLHWALRAAGEETRGSFPRSITLSLYSSSSFIGFFISEAQASIIRSFMGSFSEEVAKGADCPVRPLSKQLHLTLAHKFSPHHQGTLEHLAKSISPAQSCEWEAVLFSRDMRFAYYQTLRTLFPFEPQNPDELTLTEGDIVFVDRTRVSGAPEGWVMAVSNRTGCHGLVPENYLENVPETQTWTQHRSYKFSPSRAQQEGPHREESAETQGRARSLFIVSHGESVGDVFGIGWASAGPEGAYSRSDLNLPAHLPQRAQAAEFDLDPPLSSCGIFQASLMGQALLDLTIRLDRVLSSPALSCIQTAHHILTEMRLVGQVKICVDWRLYKWEGHGESQLPQFLSLEELEQNGYRVEISHITSGPAHQNHREGVLQSINKKKGGGTLIVTNRASVAPPTSLTPPTNY